MYFFVPCLLRDSENEEQQYTLHNNLIFLMPPPTPHHSPTILVNMHAENIPSTLVLLSGPVSIG